MGARTDNDDTKTLTVEVLAPSEPDLRDETLLPAETEGESVVTITQERPDPSDLLPADSEASTLEPQLGVRTLATNPVTNTSALDEPLRAELGADLDDATGTEPHLVDPAMVAAVRASLAAELDDATATSVDAGAIAAVIAETGRQEAAPSTSPDGEPEEEATSIDRDSVRGGLLRARGDWASSRDEKTDAYSKDDITAIGAELSGARTAARAPQEVTLASAVLATDPATMPAGISRLLTTRSALADAASSGLAFEQTDPTNRTLLMPPLHGAGNPPATFASTQPLAVRRDVVGFIGTPGSPEANPVAFTGASDAPQPIPLRGPTRRAWAIVLVLGAVVAAVLFTAFVAGRPSRSSGEEASPVAAATDGGPSSADSSATVVSPVGAPTAPSATLPPTSSIRRPPPSSTPPRPPVRSPAPKGSTPLHI